MAEDVKTRLMVTKPTLDECYEWFKTDEFREAVKGSKYFNVHFAAMMQVLGSNPDEDYDKYGIVMNVTHSGKEVSR